MKNTLNFIFFQIIWLITAFSAAHQLSIISVLCVGLAIVFYMKIAENPLNLLKLICFSAIFGFIIDTILIQLHAFKVYGNTNISPLFMVGLWINFILTFDYSLSWIHRYFKLGVLLASVGGPLAYYSGAIIGAITLNPSTLYSMTTIAIAWTVSMAILMKAYQKWH